MKADWLYLENAPAGFREAIWHPVDQNYELPDDNRWLKSQPYTRFANGPGRATFNKEALHLGNVFKADNSVLEIVGDWSNGRLIRTVRTRGPAELASREYNWDAIGAGFALGLSPVIGAGYLGTKMLEAAAEGGGAGATHLKFEGNGIHSVRVFNVTDSGAESNRKTEVSPGDCKRGGRAAESNNDTTTYQTVYVADDGSGVAGTYGYEIKFHEVVNRSFPLATPEIGRTRKFNGTITIPPGKSDGVISVGRFNWTGGNPDVRITFR